jgi:hypothetical protein
VLDAATYESQIRTLYYLLGIVTLFHGGAWFLLFTVIKAKLSESFLTRAEFATYLKDHDRWGDEVIDRLESRIMSGERSHDAVASELSQIRMLLLQSLKDSNHGSGIR